MDAEGGDSAARMRSTASSRARLTATQYPTASATKGVIPARFDTFVCNFTITRSHGNCLGAM